MTRKAEFNAEEWSTVVEGPAWAALRVISAHKGGTFRESIAVGRAYEAARKEQGQSEFLDDLVSSPPAIDKRRVEAEGGDPKAIATITTERLKEAMAILEAKVAPEEIDHYKKFVMTVAQAAAKAHKEGGFLGIGGKEVSEAEDKALDEISLALGSPPSS